MTDTYIMFVLCLVGLLDCWLEKISGRGLIARLEDFLDEVTKYRWKRKPNV